MKIAVLILHYGLIETTKRCLKELSKKIAQHQVILVNNSRDDISSLAKIIPGTKLVNNSQNLGFAAGVNRGIQLALKDKLTTHILLLNNDSTIIHGSLNQLLLTYNRFAGTGIVTPVLHHSGGYDWGGKYSKWSGRVLHRNWDNKPKTTQTVDHVAAAAMLVSRAVIDKVGLFDERFFLYFEDLDFCLRAKEAGFTIHINPDVVVEHAVSASSSIFSRTKQQWVSHFQFVTKHLFKLAYPTAYLYDLFIYPLWISGNLLKRNSRLPAEKGVAAADRRLPNG